MRRRKERRTENGEKRADKERKKGKTGKRRQKRARKWRSNMRGKETLESDKNEI